MTARVRARSGGGESRLVRAARLGRWASASWRDSGVGYAGGRYAMDVNAIWAPHALEAIGTDPRRAAHARPRRRLARAATCRTSAPARRSARTCAIPPALRGAIERWRGRVAALRRPARRRPRCARASPARLAAMPAAERDALDGASLAATQRRSRIRSSSSRSRSTAAAGRSASPTPIRRRGSSSASARPARAPDAAERRPRAARRAAVRAAVSRRAADRRRGAGRGERCVRARRACGATSCATPITDRASCGDARSTSSCSAPRRGSADAAGATPARAGYARELARRDRDGCARR